MKPSKLLSTLLWLLISFLGRLKGNALIQPDCVTPSNVLGRCIEVRFCVSVMAALTNNDHLTNPKVAQYLRESQCGLQRDSQKVCCEINDIDYGDETVRILETSTSRLSTNPQPPIKFKRLSDMDTCGKLNGDETPKKWVGELWFKIEGFSKSQLETKCLGTLISNKHLVVPAHCVASLPANVTLDFVEVGNFEFTVSKIFIHASYNQPKFANDIAIIELDKENNSDEINDAVCLPESTSNANAISSIALLKRAGGSLKFGKASSVSAGKCSSFFNQQFTELRAGQFCANVQSNETTYTPFIGAIVFESDSNRQYVFKGFTSTSIQTGQDDSRPYIFTDISSHMNWIQTAIGNILLKNKTNIPRNSPSCQMSNGSGFCVEFQQCSLYREAPQPLSQQRAAFLDQVKCFTKLPNNVEEDGVCCPLKYIDNSTKNLENSTEEYKFDTRSHRKRGVELLDLKKCGKVNSKNRIVGGSKVDLLEFPWIGLIKYKVGKIFKFTCGSSLISSRYVLTCAHCISHLPSSYEVLGVRLGEHDRSSDLDCETIDENQQECNPPVQDINFEKLIPHAKYNSPRYANDVGLIRLSEIPDMTKGIIPICLPINNEMQETVSNKYTVAGFGFTDLGQDSDVLLKVLLPKVSKETCQSFHSSVIQLSEGHECYGGEGDSGNPLMNYVNMDGKLKAVQMGIVVAGHSDCGRGALGFPGIYSGVDEPKEQCVLHLMYKPLRKKMKSKLPVN